MLITFPDLAGYGIKLTRPSIRALAKKGLFPKPLRVGLHHIAWHEADICEWLAALPKAEDAPMHRNRPTAVARALAKAKCHKVRA